MKTNRTSACLRVPIMLRVLQRSFSFGCISLLQIIQSTKLGAAHLECRVRGRLKSGWKRALHPDEVSQMVGGLGGRFVDFLVRCLSCPLSCLPHQHPEFLGSVIAVVPGKDNATGDSIEKWVVHTNGSIKVSQIQKNNIFPSLTCVSGMARQRVFAPSILHLDDRWLENTSLLSSILVLQHEDWTSIDRQHM